MTEKQKEDFKENLTKAIRDVGDELINMADDIAIDADKSLISKMTITVTFDPAYSMYLPIIEVNKEYLCKTAMDRLSQQQVLL